MVNHGWITLPDFIFPALIRTQMALECPVPNLPFGPFRLWSGSALSVLGCNSHREGDPALCLSAEFGPFQIKSVRKWSGKIKSGKVDSIHYH